MSFIDAIKSYFKNYATFKGRARRSEFWFTVLFTVLVSSAISIIAPGHREMMGDFEVDQSSTLSNLWSLATIVPSLAVTWRRLHDVGRSGNYFFFILIPIAGIIMLLIQLTKDSQPEANEYGASVKVVSGE
ncbi:unannotated protein [freshwater metagenome]|uniref:Unannotated protein n=1 Tax=freshwater metagenome TaxID=449393 RepID=A0A6J6JB22_9ZZZZ|nr:DUF805 domain-containing protein [Actinomycetota bacterium]